MAEKQITKVCKEFDYKWVDSIELLVEDRLQIEIFIESVIRNVNAKFTANNIHDSLNNYFFFPGMDDEDLFSAHSFLQSSFNNVKALENSLSKEDQEFIFELREIKFNADLSMNISMIIYSADYFIKVFQCDKEVYINLD